MISRRNSFHFELILGFLAFHYQLHAQARPTATERLQLSVFAGGSCESTGVYDNHAFGITAGGDLSMRRIYYFNPSLEVRGTYMFSGGVVRTRNILGGLAASHPFGRIISYADFLVGRGQINYGTGVPDYLGTTAYVQTPSNVYSPGFGLDVNLNRQLSFRGDAQFQRYSTPVLASGVAHTTVISAGAKYVFDFNKHPYRSHH